MANPNKIVITDIDAADQQWIYDGKQLELQGGALGAIIVTHGNLKLSGEMSIGQVIVVDPRDGQGEPDNGVYLSGLTGSIDLITTLGTKRDHGKLGSDTHDLTIGAWYGRCAPPDPTPPGQDPVHRDGLQISKAQRVTLGYFDFLNLYPGATNGGVWINPQKAGSDDDDNPSLCQDVVIEGGVIANPNAAIHLGACTRCGARGTTLIAQRPFRLKETAVDPIDEDNTHVVIQL